MRPRCQVTVPVVLTTASLVRIAVEGDFGVQMRLTQGESAREGRARNVGFRKTSKSGRLRKTSRYATARQ